MTFCDRHRHPIRVVGRRTGVWNDTWARGNMTVDTSQKTRQGLGFGGDKEGERVAGRMRCAFVSFTASPSFFLSIRNSPVLSAVFHLLFFHFSIATTLPSFAGDGSRSGHLTDAKLVCFSAVVQIVRNPRQYGLDIAVDNPEFDTPAAS
jgi:hypothetical protein